MHKDNKEIDHIISLWEYFVVGLIAGNIGLIALILYILQAGPL